VGTGPFSDRLSMKRGPPVATDIRLNSSAIHIWVVVTSHRVTLDRLRVPHVGQRYKRADHRKATFRLFRRSSEDARAAVATSLLLIVRMIPEGALHE
jgi:hypothetical protein